MASDRLENLISEKDNVVRKFVVAFFVFTLMLGGISGAVYAGNCHESSSLDKAGDWFATLGQEGLKKQQTLVKRKYKRFSSCVQKSKHRKSVPAPVDN